MEWIGIGIMLAIGFYLAPVVVMIVISLISLPFVIIGNIFKNIFRR
jgi:hypothetical protein